MTASQASLADDVRLDTLTAVLDAEHLGTRQGSEARGGKERGPIDSARSRWFLGALVVFAILVWQSGIGRRDVVNQGGWSVFQKFWAAMLNPDLSGELLRTTASATVTTVAFAVLGSALAVVIGLVGGVAMSRTWWERSERGGIRSARVGWYVMRAVGAIPRGVHEAVVALLLVNVLGRDPIVGIAALAIPFGAIAAKVFADLIDTSGRRPYEALRTLGAGRIASFAYGVFPITGRDMVSYGFYRLECAIRSAVILGMIGAGGIGFELALRFQSLQYRQMWTLIWVLVGLSACADLWGSTLRRRRGVRTLRWSLIGGLALIVGSVVHLGPDLGRLFSAKTRTLAAEIIGKSWPPSAPRDGWWGLVQRSIDTITMSLLAIGISSVLAVGFAIAATRVANRRGPASWIVGKVARLVLMIVRAIPPPVWALLVLFIMFPGPLPGAVALGIYNFGVLGRLWAEVFENLDERPQRALVSLGASRMSAFLYATLPQSATKLTSYALYRWEVAARETVVVGVVGAAGLGRLLEQQRVSFDFSGMLATVLALIAVSLVVDVISTLSRRAIG